MQLINFIVFVLRKAEVSGEHGIHYQNNWYVFELDFIVFVELFRSLRESLAFHSL
jgi:hypothetical protein